MTSKDLLLKDKDLTAKLAGVTNADWFKQALLFVRSAMMEGRYSAEALSGAKSYERELLTITDPESPRGEPIQSGIQHRLDDPKHEITRTQ